jgi:hypothetical protein
MGIITITGTNNTVRCMNLVAVRIGSHIFWHNKSKIRERMDCRGSEGEDMRLRFDVGCVEQGMIVGEVKREGICVEGCGRK